MDRLGWTVAALAVAAVLFVAVIAAWVLAPPDGTGAGHFRCVAAGPGC